MKTSIPPVLITFAVVCFGLVQNTQAVSPPPDGGYPGGNTAEGQNALLSLTTGTYNTAVGIYSLLSDTTGRFNTGIGAGTLLANTGDQNTATGAGALLSNVNGNDNTANGAFALFKNVGGAGVQGAENTAIGFETLFSNTTGAGNTALGSQALNNNVSGFANVAVGFQAGNNITTAHNVIAIGTGGHDISDSLFIGNIVGVTIATGVPLVIDTMTGQIGEQSSSSRFKRNIKTIDNASESILALKPVTFQYKSDKTNTPQFGLIAEEVQKVNPDLVVPDTDGKPHGVRYEAVNAMLLNEFLKEHRKVEKLEATVAQQRKDFQAAIEREREEMQAAVSQLNERVQKVSAPVELSKHAPKTVLNSR